MIDYKAFLQERINSNYAKFNLDKESANYNEIISTLKKIIDNEDDIKNGFYLSFNDSLTQYSKRKCNFVKINKELL